MFNDIEENAQKEDKPLSENARKLVDLIVRIIVTATLREVEMKNKAEPIQEVPLIKKGKRDSNRKK